LASAINRDREIVSAETTKASFASARHRVARDFVFLNFGNQARAIPLTSKRLAYQLLRAAVTVISRGVDQDHAERTCGQRFLLQLRRMPALAEMPGILTDCRHNGAIS
jgi:hypothetical protein